MCQFNFLVTKERFNQSEIKEIATDNGLNFTEKELDIKNSDRIQTFLTTTENCDCGSVIGKNNWNDSMEPDWEKERKKLVRKRYSKRRIELLLEQKEINHAKKNKDEFENELIESQKWLEFLNDAQLKSNLNEVGIFHHQFSGLLEDERIKIESEKTALLKNINVDFLKNIKENEVVWIKL